MPTYIPQLRHAAIVPGLAIYTGCTADDVANPFRWIGAYQDEAPLYIEHVKAAILAAAVKPDMFVILSGGETKHIVGPFSEALGLFRLCEQCQWFDHPDVRERTATEIFARDSFENVLNGVRRFEECVGYLPDEVMVFGYSFKEQRFKFHAETIRNNPHLGCGKFTFNYIGVNNPPEAALTGPDGALAAEARTLALFNETPLGDAGKLLQKRLQRDPFHRGNAYIGHP
jgi:hypothetical protein